MILKESRELEWIQQLRIRYPYTNPTLIEKAIRAFSLLEALAVSGCPFISQLPEGSDSSNERVDREILEHTYDGNFLDPAPTQFQMLSYSLAASSE